MRQMNNPDYLHTVSLNELFDNVYESRPSIIDGLLYAGAYFLAGAPKIGKSFLVAQIAYHVGTGQPLWGYEVHQGSVLYLALEDDYGRLQGRMSRMFGVGDEGSVFFSVQAKLLSDGLDGSSATGWTGSLNTSSASTRTRSSSCSIRCKRCGRRRGTTATAATTNS